MKNRDDLAQATWLAVDAAYRTCARRYEEMLADLELSAAQYEAMDAINRLGGEAQPKRIAQELLVTRGNITGMLDRLSRKGLIRIRPHPDDGRARIVALTAGGRALVERAGPRTRAFIEAQMKPFSDRDLQRTHAVMKRMKLHLEQLDPNGLVESIEQSLEVAPRQSRLI